MLSQIVEEDSLFLSHVNEHNDMMDDMISAERQYNSTRRNALATDFKKLKRRQGISVDIVEKFGEGLEKYRNLKKLGGRNALKNKDEFYGIWLR